MRLIAVIVLGVSISISSYAHTGVLGDDGGKDWTCDKVLSSVMELDEPSAAQFLDLLKSHGDKSILRAVEDAPSAMQSLIGRQPNKIEIAVGVLMDLKVPFLFSIPRLPNTVYKSEALSMIVYMKKREFQSGHFEIDSVLFDHVDIEGKISESR